MAAEGQWAARPSLTLGRGRPKQPWGLRSMWIWGSGVPVDRYPDPSLPLSVGWCLSCPPGPMVSTAESQGAPASRSELAGARVGGFSDGGTGREEDEESRHSNGSRCGCSRAAVVVCVTPPPPLPLSRLQLTHGLSLSNAHSPPGTLQVQTRGHCNTSAAVKARSSEAGATTWGCGYTGIGV